jgi:hypothetical protein
MGAVPRRKAGISISLDAYTVIGSSNVPVSGAIGIVHFTVAVMEAR